MAIKNRDLSIIAPAELILNALLQLAAAFALTSGSPALASFLSLAGLLLHLILIGYRIVSLMVGFLNDVKPMMAVSDTVLKELQ